MTQNALEISGLSKYYESKKNYLSKAALNSVNLKIEKGSIFALLGPNGAGKTTIINILSGLVSKNSGTISIMGFDTDKHPLITKNLIGVAPQEVAIDPFFTVRQALTIYGGYFGINNIKNRSEELINALGLQDKANSAPRSLSGGMKRRLMIAKALIHDPDILLLDEPSAGVDVELRSQLWDYVLHLRSRGKTIILTTHYIEEAERLCDSLAIMNEGKVLISDKKDKILDTLPKKEFIITINKKITREILEAIKPDNISLQKESSYSIVFHCEPKSSNIDKIIKKIIAEGLAICEVSVRSAKLEDVFRYFTKGQ